VEQDEVTEVTDELVGAARSSTETVD
jgi:hypothetical protein